MPTLQEDLEAVVTAIGNDVRRLDTEKLSATDAEDLPALNDSVNEDDLIIVVREGVPYLAVVDDLPSTGGGGGGSMSPLEIRNALESLQGNSRLHADFIAGLPTLAPGNPVSVTHNGSGEAPVLGDTLSVSFSDGWFGIVQWERNQAPIPGATGNTYTLDAADAGTHIAPAISGLGYVAQGHSVPSAGATAPAAFVDGDWTATAGVEQIVVNITALPADGGSAITALQYRLDGAAPVTMAGTGIGSRTITGLSATPYNVQIRAVNAIESDPNNWSDVKTRTPTVAGGGGDSNAVWEGVEVLDAKLETTPTAVPHPAGAVASDTLIMLITGITQDMASTIVPPAGYTLRHTYINANGFGLGGPEGSQGVAVFTAPGNTAPGDWSCATRAADVFFEVHRWSGVNAASPFKVIPPATNDSEVWGPANGYAGNMPSPTVTVEAGEGVLAYTYLPQASTAVEAVPEGYTRAADGVEPGTHSTLVRSNMDAGATGAIAHGTAGAWQARFAMTLIMNKAA